jgi:hypothetical protein
MLVTGSKPRTVSREAQLNRRFALICCAFRKKKGSLICSLDIRAVCCWRLAQTPRPPS